MVLRLFMQSLLAARSSTTNSIVRVVITKLASSQSETLAVFVKAQVIVGISSALLGFAFFDRIALLAIALAVCLHHVQMCSWARSRRVAKTQVWLAGFSRALTLKFLLFVFALGGMFSIMPQAFTPAATGQFFALFLVSYMTPYWICNIRYIQGHKNFSRG